MDQFHSELAAADTVLFAGEIDLPGVDLASDEKPTRRATASLARRESRAASAGARGAIRRVDRVRALVVESEQWTRAISHTLASASAR